MKKTLGLFAMVALLSGAASASSVWNTSADLTGSRSGSNLVTSAGWSAMQIDWSIVLTDSTYTYTYTFSGPQRPGLSHFTLELSDSCKALNSVSDPCFVEDYPDSKKFEGPKNFSGGAGDPGWPTGVTIYGVKLDFGGDFGPVTYTFESNRAPVWGNFFTKGGSGDYAYNKGMAIADFESLNTSYFIARPDTDTGTPTGDEIPEPATFAMLGGALLGLAMLRRKQQ